MGVTFGADGTARQKEGPGGSWVGYQQQEEIHGRGRESKHVRLDGCSYKPWLTLSPHTGISRLVISVSGTFIMHIALIAFGTNGRFMRN